ncbi:MAG: tRNA (adenosine(37)-N6)-threonylcarbamoyltransferase complex ATPase subunit type 1 TsaE [Pseudomonadota bacterium]|nr:tRNA (adenosine(37)-N6)-threonylcarbamoyltransferase complex ATPase subunit type 1 TsaE [Pseudomonadota bacterium]
MSAAEPADIILSLSVTTAAETQALAAALARHCRSGDCLLLRGELGSGKTTFARGFIQALCPGEEVVSPTFTLVQTYPGSQAPIWHFDLYRLKHPGELAEIGLQEALATGIALIEWPELAQSQLPGDALGITIESGPGPEQRLLTFAGRKSVWQSRLEAMKGE